MLGGRLLGLEVLVGVSGIVTRISQRHASFAAQERFLQRMRGTAMVHIARIGEKGTHGTSRSSTSAPPRMGYKQLFTPPLPARPTAFPAAGGCCLARTFLGANGQGNRRWNEDTLEMTQDTRDHRFLGHGGNDPKRTHRRHKGHVAEPQQSE